ncbi:MAG: PAS domain S-box protein, partial [Deltaproteobacteria bacterium]|nr:PAS domain S-box protein [Deltaproteobacteria bacterium]
MECPVETKINPVLTDVILNSLNDGLYVCDLERTILYWSKAAERITGWTSEEVVGHKCSDNILVHIDKDGRELCGEEFCPLHRCMHTNKSSTESVLIFGQTNVGDRVAMTVSVAPIHD